MHKQNKQTACSRPALLPDANALFPKVFSCNGALLDRSPMFHIKPRSDFHYLLVRNDFISRLCWGAWHVPSSECLDAGGLNPFAAPYPR